MTYRWLRRERGTGPPGTASWAQTWDPFSVEIRVSAGGRRSLTNNEIILLFLLMEMVMALRLVRLSPRCRRSLSGHGGRPSVIDHGWWSRSQSSDPADQHNIVFRWFEVGQSAKVGLTGAKQGKGQDKVRSGPGKVEQIGINGSENRVSGGEVEKLVSGWP